MAKAATRTVTIPWGGDLHDELAAYRKAAMSGDQRLTVFAPGDEDPTAPYEVVVVHEVTADRATVLEVTLRARDGAPINGAVWRTVRVQECVAWARHQLAWAKPHAAKWLRERGRDAEAEQVENVDVGGARKAGRPPTFGRDHYAEVAALYVAAKAQGSPTPLKDVARHMARQHAGDGRYDGITDSGDYRVKGWVNRATTLGLIEQED